VLRPQRETRFTHRCFFPGLVALLLGIALGTIVLNFAISLKILSNAFLNGLGPF